MEDKYMITNKITREIMKIFYTLIVFFMATQFMMAQGQSMQRFISKNKTAFVANLTPYKTYQKLDKETTKKYNVSEKVAPILLQMAGGDMSEENIKKIETGLADSKKTGLNIEQEVYIWAQRPENPSAEMYQNDPNAMFINIVIPVIDGKKLKGFLDNLFGKSKTKTTIPANGALSIVHNGVLINWNKDRLILARSTGEQGFFEEEAEYKSRTIRMLIKHAEELSGLDTRNSIEKDVDYQKHLQKDAEFDLWMDYSSLMPPLDQMPREAREIVGALFEFVGDMKLGGNGFLKDGEAEFLTEVYVGDAMANVLAQSYGISINKDFFKYIDKTNLMGMYSFAMNPKGFVSSYGEELYKVLKKSKEGTLITSMLDIIDIFIDEDEIYTLFKGDMLMAVTDVKVVDQKTSDYEYNEETDNWEEVTTTRKTPLPIATMMLSYGSKENIMKFIDLGANAGVLSKRADGIWAVGGIKEEVGFDVFIAVHNGILMVTNDENITKNLNGIPKGKQLSNKAIKDITSYVQYGLFDISNISSRAKKALEEMNQSVPNELAKIEETFKRFEFKTFKPEGNEMKSDFRLQLKDPKANVLQTMVDGILRIAERESSKNNRNSAPAEKEEEPGTKKL